MSEEYPRALPCASSNNDLPGLHPKQEHAGMQDVDNDDSDLSSIEEGGDNDAGRQRPASSRDLY